jgi:lipoic acid synthetase
VKSAARDPKPSWLKVRPPSGASYERIKGLSKSLGLATVCEEARCPNIAECWGGGTATFMVMGERCSRGCRFCSVESALKLPPLDAEEPRKLAESLSAMGLEYAVVTTVCRDDLPDQGAAHLASCIREIKSRCPGLLLEVLIQDFRGERGLIRLVSEAGADVLAHNVETVERLTPAVRDARAGYGQSLEVLRCMKELKPERHTKSSLMLGLGEAEEELVRAFSDLREAGVTILTLGQYLRPSGMGRNLPVVEYVEPARFDRYRELAEKLGFLYVASGPFVRSSYRAGELFLKGMLNYDRHHA